MKSFTMAAAAMLIAGSVFAQVAPKVQVYDFKASLKNSNVGTKLDSKLNAFYCYKFTENNALCGYLIVPDCSDCAEGNGESVLYVTRTRDTQKVVYRLTAQLAIADVFASRTVYDVENQEFGVVLSKNAEGFLVINPVLAGEDITGFFNRAINHDTEEFMDEGFTKFWAAGFGTIQQGKGYTEVIPNEDPCIPPEQVWVPGCIVLNNLSGQIVGIMQLTAPCGVPYVDLCTFDAECVNDDGDYNAVASGSWQMRRNARMESVDMESAEQAVLAKYANYQVVNGAQP